MLSQERLIRKDIVRSSPALTALNTRCHDHRLPPLDSEYSTVTAEELGMINDYMNSQVVLPSEFSSLSRCIIGMLLREGERQKVVSNLVAKTRKHLRR